MLSAARVDGYLAIPMLVVIYALTRPHDALTDKINSDDPHF